MKMDIELHKTAFYLSNFGFSSMVSFLIFKA
ncbi:hypothetical protein T02_7392 [Trichinella nativa]|uniref:Uncharacterized protein n=1 Tax=Trichinella nativa TaxID=6335 RepID=A0A0V1KJ92_9BILA|nr:hypothetical protein T02_7392 [Trichinella nativa]